MPRILKGHEASQERPAEEGNGSKQPMRAVIRKHIQKLISTGVYKPGDRVVETRLAKELNVSQAPVREAILELSVMGLLEERSYSGTFVRRLSAADIEDIYHTRAFIEEYAAKRAAENAETEQIEELERTVESMEHATDQDSFFALDTRFHELVMDAAHSDSLKRVWKTLRMEEWTYTTLLTQRSLPSLAAAHREIFDFIKRGADHSAGAAMFLHIKGFTDDLIEHLSAKDAERSIPFKADEGDENGKE